MTKENETENDSEVPYDLKKLTALVKTLQIQIEQLKSELKNVTMTDKDAKTKPRTKCGKCEATFKSFNEKNDHMKTYHPVQLKCNSCDFTCDKSVELETHIKLHHQQTETFKCDECDKEFALKWRLNKHMKLHRFKVNFCHYYNNEESCPFDEFGCKFRHEESQKCFNFSTCKRKLCQYRHSKPVDDQRTDNINTIESQTETTAKITEDNQSKPNINCDDIELRKGKDFYCEHFCSNKFNLHTHNKEDYDSLKGIKIKEISSKFQVETMAFVKNFPCEVCDVTSSGIDEHRKHFQEVHKSIQFDHACLFNNCEFKTLFPEELVKHFADKHEKSITNIMKKLAQKA